MINRRYLKQIWGKIFINKEYNDTQSNKQEDLKDIRITLNLIGEIENYNSKDNHQIRILKERSVMSTKTNELGEFRFLVYEGAYSLSVDTNTLPQGKSIVEASKIIEYLQPGNVNFELRDIKLTDIKKHTSDDLHNHIVKASSVEKIRHANRMGKIDDGEKIRNYIYSLYDKIRVPNEYQSNIPLKSGTIIYDEIKRYISRDDADKSIIKLANRYISLNIPKLDRVYKSPSGYFNIHYTTRGQHAVSTNSINQRIVPAYIKEIGVAFDYVKAKTCDERGFRQPILDDGKNIFDIYVYNQKNIYGVTYANTIYKDKISGKRVASCSICIDNNYSRQKGFDKSKEDCMRVTAAHEFFHAVQYAYNVDSDGWWKEACATWNEDEIYTGIDDYVRYLSTFFSAPEKSLDESSYSSVIFVKYLSEKLGGYNIVKRIWDIQSQIYDNSLSSIDRAVRETGINRDIGTMFNEFTSYNYNPSQYYREGNKWGVKVRIDNLYSNYPVSKISYKLNHLASCYQLFKSNETMNGKTLKIIVESDAKSRVGFKIQRKRKEDKEYSVKEISLNSLFNRSEIIIEDFYKNYDDICLIPANLELDKDEVEFSYFASIQ